MKELWPYKNYADMAMMNITVINVDARQIQGFLLKCTRSGCMRLRDRPILVINVTIKHLILVVSPIMFKQTLGIKVCAIPHILSLTLSDIGG